MVFSNSMVNIEDISQYHRVNIVLGTSKHDAILLILIEMSLYLKYDTKILHICNNYNLRILLFSRIYKVQSQT